MTWKLFSFFKGKMKFCLYNFGTTLLLSHKILGSTRKNYGGVRWNEIVFYILIFYEAHAPYLSYYLPWASNKDLYLFLWKCLKRNKKIEKISRNLFHFLDILFLFLLNNFFVLVIFFMETNKVRRVIRILWILVNTSLFPYFS